MNRRCNDATADAMIAEMATEINYQDVQSHKGALVLGNGAIGADEGRSDGQASRVAGQRTRKVVPCSGVLAKEAAPWRYRSVNSLML